MKVYTDIVGTLIVGDYSNEDAITLLKFSYVIGYEGPDFYIIDKKKKKLKGIQAVNYILSLDKMTDDTFWNIIQDIQYISDEKKIMEKIDENNLKDFSEIFNKMNNYLLMKISKSNIIDKDKKVFNSIIKGKDFFITVCQNIDLIEEAGVNKDIFTFLKK